MGGGGGDTDVYNAISESTSTGYDTVSGFDADGSDLFDTTATVTAVAAFSHAVSAATFDADMGAAFGDGLYTGTAAVLHVDGGDLMDHDFLVINPTSSHPYYEAGTAYVIDITGYTGTIDTGDFI